MDLYTSEKVHSGEHHGLTLQIGFTNLNDFR